MRQLTYDRDLASEPNDRKHQKSESLRWNRDSVDKESRSQGLNGFGKFCPSIVSLGRTSPTRICTLINAL